MTSHRPYDEDAYPDPRGYDLWPRPTTRGYPHGWIPAGALAHRLATMRVLSFLHGWQVGRTQYDTVRHQRDEALARSDRATRVGHAIRALADDLLSDPTHSSADTEPIDTRRSA